ncbi:VOC family protein [Glycomyces luteolus]|uniref:VOC family protein n=1 Tax=Glycomyces luteolus TaxID=2670330 RepID=A0A9X3SSW5_9ACTN|nr:VOC family protein [Glycomyces luteolus]MDA1363041.1 VOC family protein [Glycomyces luteolus]
MSANDITGLHHVGLVVHDMDAAIDTFRRLGFDIGSPAYPALPPAPDAEPEPIGAGNTHADFSRGFIELLAFAPEDRDQLPADARLVPLQVPDDQLAATRTAIRGTVAALETRLHRSEGAHILIFSTVDADRTAARLTSINIGHTGARPAQRPITTAAGTSLAPIKYLEISDDQSGLLPEGRIGAAEDAPPELLDAQTGLDHPNGAIGLAEGVLCVDDGDLDATADRYGMYLNRIPTGHGDMRTIELGAHRLTITTPRRFAERLPGEAPRSSSLSAYAIEVADLAATEELLRARGTDLRKSPAGEPFIPADAAHGTPILLRQATPAAYRGHPSLLQLESPSPCDPRSTASAQYSSGSSERCCPGSVLSQLPPDCRLTDHFADPSERFSHCSCS